jgi:hypothetical protein
MKKIKYIISPLEKHSGIIVLFTGLLICGACFLPGQDQIIWRALFFSLGAFLVWLGLKQSTEIRATEINYEEGYVEQRWGIFKTNKNFRINLSCFSEVIVNLDYKDSRNWSPQNYGVCLVGHNMVYNDKTIKDYYLYITPHQKFRKSRDLALEISEYTKLPFDSEKKPECSIYDFENVTKLKYNEWF